MENYDINKSNISSTYIIPRTIDSGSWVSTGTSATDSIYNGTIYDNIAITTNTTMSSLFDDIKEIKKRLLILERDIKMEKLYPELKEAYDNYEKILKNIKVYEAITDQKGDE